MMRLGIITCAIAALYGGAVSANNNVAGREQIVVTGERISSQAVSDFVRTIGQTSSGDQLARWHQPVCPYVSGLSEEHNGYIAGTITAVAEAVGTEAADEGCTVNLVTIFTSEPDAVIGELRDRQPLLFESVDAARSSRLNDSGEPVRTWSAIATRSSDGRPIVRSGPTSRFESLVSQDVEILTGVLPSRILRSTQVNLSTTFIIIDSARAEGLNLQQLSGFITMLALGQMDIRDPIRPERSILNLFHETATPPSDLSDWDVAYLRALYATDNRRSASAQRGQMARMMREMLTQEEE